MEQSSLDALAKCMNEGKFYVRDDRAIKYLADKKIEFKKGGYPAHGTPTFTCQVTKLEDQKPSPNLNSYAYVPKYIMFSVVEMPSNCGALLVWALSTSGDITYVDRKVQYGDAKIALGFIVKHLCILTGCGVALATHRDDQWVLKDQQSSGCMSEFYWDKGLTWKSPKHEWSHNVSAFRLETPKAEMKSGGMNGAYVTGKYDLYPSKQMREVPPPVEVKVLESVPTTKRVPRSVREGVNRCNDPRCEVCFKDEKVVKTQIPVQGFLRKPVQTYFRDKFGRFTSKQYAANR